jgi:hypothetical protein
MIVWPQAARLYVRNVRFATKLPMKVTHQPATISPDRSK